MPRRKLLPLLAFLAILTSQCSRYSYYASPFYGVDHPYRSHLLNTDSANKATYANVTLSGSGYNDDLVDGAWMLQSSVYQSHKFGSFRGWYGGMLGLGQYDIADYSGYNAFGNTDPAFINANAGTTFMGGVGAFGGLSVVAKLDEDNEWRVLSFETSYLKEFGGYMNFRNKLSDTIADAFYEPDYFLTSAFGTEFTGRTRRGEFGFKVNYIVDWNRMTGYFENGRVNPRLSNLNMTFHLTRANRNYFFTIGTGSYAINFAMGMNFRLSKL